MKDAKRHYNIPKNQSPERKKTNLDRRDKKQPCYVYVYKDIHGKEIEFRDDHTGIKFEDGNYLPPILMVQKENTIFIMRKEKFIMLSRKKRKKNKK